MTIRSIPAAPHRWCLIGLILCGSAAAQVIITDNFAIGATLNREVIVLPSTAASAQIGAASGPMFARSVETSSARIHTVSFEGEAFRASTPLEGPASRIVFDPAQRRFAALLPSIRVELDDYSRLDAIAESLGAVDARAFERLGFAVIVLPEALHPAEAIERLAALEEGAEASLRLRGPRIRWW